MKNIGYAFGLIAIVLLGILFLVTHPEPSPQSFEVTAKVQFIQLGSNLMNGDLQSILQIKIIEADNIEAGRTFLLNLDVEAVGELEKGDVIQLNCRGIERKYLDCDRSYTKK